MISGESSTPGRSQLARCRGRGQRWPRGGCEETQAIFCPDHPGAGSAANSARQFSRRARSRPSATSPWIFGAPQPEFSCAKRRIRTRISSLILGRPPRGRDFQRQYSRKPARCQPTTVSGWTITSASFHRDQVTRKTVQKSRSRGRNGGLGRLRLRTATCWRRARTSTTTSVRLWKNTRAAASKASTNGSTDYPF